MTFGFIRRRIHFMSFKKALILVISLTLVVSFAFKASAESPISDYFTQNVCVDNTGKLLPNDPYVGCPADSTERDLLPGDKLPYHKHDQPDANNPQGFQRQDSFVSKSSSTLRYVSTFDFFPFGEFNSNKDGYNIAEADGEFAAVIGTRDPVGLAQTFYGNNCAFSDGWILSKTQGYSASGSTTATLKLVGWEKLGQSFPGTCPTSYDSANTWWQEYPGLTFGGINGAPTKTMDSLVSHHEGIGHIEKFYFTKKYGFTRWERWESDASAVEKPEGCNGGTLAGNYKRVDCRDWSVIIPEAVTGGAQTNYSWVNPYAYGNLLKNGDFGTGNQSNWNKLSTTNWVIETNLGNSLLAISCGAICNGHGVYQDLTIGGTKKFSFGGKFSVKSGTGAKIQMKVFQMSGPYSLAQNSKNFDVTTTPAEFKSGIIQVASGVKSLRLILYPLSLHTFNLDDIWLVAE